MDAKDQPVAQPERWVGTAVLRLTGAVLVLVVALVLVKPADPGEVEHILASVGRS